MVSDRSKNYLKHKTGIEAENRVALHFEQQGWAVVRRRFRTPFAEVDLLLRDSKGVLVVVEVKHVKYESFKQEPVPVRQLKRLKRACLYLEAQALLVAAVGQDDEIVVLDRF